jgi:hypothetical protein
MRKLLLVMGIVMMGILAAGCTQSPSTPAPGTYTTASTTVVPATSQSSQVSVTYGSVTVPAATPLVIPATGVFVYVNYLGAFSGSFGAPVNMLPIQESGERLYPVDGLNGTVSAGFAKLDGSDHPITVRIYENGQIMQAGTSSSPYGTVNITSSL